MKFYTFGCTCGCPDPLLAIDDEGSELVRIFRTREAAQVAASDLDPTPLIIECEVTQV